MRTAGGVKGAREGRDIIQCRGSCFCKKHFIGVVTTELKISGLVIHSHKTKCR